MNNNLIEQSFKTIGFFTLVNFDLKYMTLNIRVEYTL